MTSWPEARSLAWSCCPPLAPVDVPLAGAAGAVLAEPLWSLAPLPPFDTSAMDGYAVRGPGPWRVVGRVLAGQPAPAPLADGCAVEVATGACVPPGTDGVLPVERAVRSGDDVVGEAPQGRHVRRAGEECAARTALLPAGTRLGAAALGLAAAVGHDLLRVRTAPTVAALVTGDELLPAGLPGEGRVRDAVGPLLPGAVAGLGGRLVGSVLLGDDAGALATALREADADVVVTSGATAAGPADHLAAALSAVGADVVLHGVDVRPGHPQLLARLPDGRPVVGLPGNPLAALAALVTLLGPLLAGLTGRALPPLGRARAVAPLPGGPVHRLVPVAVQDGLARPTGHGGAAMLRGAATASAFAVVPPGDGVAAGGAVDVVALPG